MTVDNHFHTLLCGFTWKFPVCLQITIVSRQQGQRCICKLNPALLGATLGHGHKPIQAARPDLRTINRYTHALNTTSAALCQEVKRAFRCGERMEAANDTRRLQEPLELAATQFTASLYQRRRIARNILVEAWRLWLQFHARQQAPIGFLSTWWQRGMWKRTHGAAIEESLRAVTPRTQQLATDRHRLFRNVVWVHRHPQ
mmetsp:Transcript_20579/g.47189  ORF Transcript_20579/g.47189 Transcript_20579/m.47189 type:complete len:200 (+) Transcript_20579:451-1050(+)